MRTMTKLAEIVRELTEKAENEVKSIIQSEEELAEYLTFCSKFYHYSSRNQLLIYHQRPGAVSCLGFSEMKKRGLHLRKGSKAIQILAPMIVKEEDEQTQEEIEKVKGYKYVNVFDITQTDLAPEDYPKHFPNKPYIFKYDFNIDDMQRAIQSLANDMHVTIEIDTNDSVGAARGAYYPQLEKILLNAGNTESQNIAVQFHELAHAHLHNFRKNPKSNKAIKETQAEMVAHIVSKYFGMDTTEKSIHYISSWSNKLKAIPDKELPNVFSEIQNTAKYFIMKISKVIG